MVTLITGLGLVGTSYAQLALKRGESIVFYDIAPRKDFLAYKLGTANVTVGYDDIYRGSTETACLSTGRLGRQ